MTTLFSDGFESGNFGAWTGTYGSPSVVSTNPHSGVYNAKALPTSSAVSFYCDETVNQGVIYKRGYFYFTQMPTAADGNYIEVLRFMCGSTGLFGVRIAYSSSLGATRLGVFYRNGTTVYFAYNNSVTFQINTWYCIELYCLVDSSAGVYQAWVNGSSAINETGMNTNAYGNITQARVGVQTSALTTETPQVDWDNVVIADAYIGPMVQTITCGDAGAASDSAGLAATVPAGESASGSELPTINLRLSESAQGVEAAHPVLFFGESALGSEAGQLKVSTAESAGGAEIARLALSAGDIGAGADSAGMQAVINAPEYAFGGDLSLVRAAIGALECGSGADHARAGQVLLRLVRLVGDGSPVTLNAEGGKVIIRG